MKIKLDSRLSALYNEIIPCKLLADIGCDHGYITVRALLDYKAESVISTDISEKSLLKAKKLAYDLALTDDIIFIHGDGLKILQQYDIDQVVIAGMGGNEIKHILNESEKTYNRYILLPHRDDFLLREYLWNNNFNIIKDKIVKCGGKFYSIIVVDNSLEKTANIYKCQPYLTFGFSNNKYNSDFVEYLTFLKEKTLNLLKIVKNDEKKILYCKNLLELISIAKKF